MNGAASALAHKLRDKTSIVASHMTESKQQESYSPHQHREAGSLCIRELRQSQSKQTDKNWIIMCAQGWYIHLMHTYCREV